MNAPIPEERVNQIKAAIFEGNKIEAIKHFREHTGKGLAEAKEFIENLTTELKTKEPEKFKVPASAKGCAGVFALLGIIVFAALLSFIRFLGRPSGD